MVFLQHELIARVVSLRVSEHHAAHEPDGYDRALEHHRAAGECVPPVCCSLSSQLRVLISFPFLLELNL